MLRIFDISRDDCVRLLGAGIAGRVAFNTPAGPHIVPVNYVVDGPSVLVRTAAYSLFGTHGRDSMVCFEVDHFDYENHRGWSVVVRGRATFVDDDSELEELNRSWRPQPWAAGQRNLVVRIPFSEVSGRQIGDGWDPWEHLPVRRVQ